MLLRTELLRAKPTAVRRNKWLGPYVGAALATAMMLLPAAPRAADPDAPGGHDDAAADGAGTPSIEEETNRDHYYVALGPVFVPDYEGSDDYELQPLPIARWIRRGAYLELYGNTLTANVIPASPLQAGPVLSWRRSRSDVEDPRVDRMRDVSGALEAGGFIGLMLYDAESRRHLRLMAQLLQDVSGSHDSHSATLKLEGGTPFGDDWAVDVQMFADYGGGNFMDSYFSVDADNAARSGLSRHDADAGFADAGLRVMVSHQFTDHWGIGVIGGYKRMLGDAGDSPVVADVGSRNQFLGALVGTWRY